MRQGSRVAFSCKWHLADNANTNECKCEFEFKHCQRRCDRHAQHSSFAPTKHNSKRNKAKPKQSKNKTKQKQNKAKTKRTKRKRQARNALCIVGEQQFHDFEVVLVHRANEGRVPVSVPSIQRRLTSRRDAAIVAPLRGFCRVGSVVCKHGRSVLQQVLHRFDFAAPAGGIECCRELVSLLTLAVVVFVVAIVVGRPDAPRGCGISSTTTTTTTAAAAATATTLPWCVGRLRWRQWRGVRRWQPNGSRFTVGFVS